MNIYSSIIVSLISFPILIGIFTNIYGRERMIDSMNSENPSTVGVLIIAISFIISMCFFFLLHNP